MKYTLVGKKTGLEIPVTDVENSSSWDNGAPKAVGWWATVEEDGYHRRFYSEHWDLVTDQTNLELFDSLEPGDKFTSPVSDALGYYIKLDDTHLYWVNNRYPEHNNLKNRDEFFSEEDEYEAKITKLEDKK